MPFESSSSIDHSKVKMRSYSDLPEEIIVDILSRLPAKSVGQCRCVSKPWLALLTRPDFIKTHLGLARIAREELIIFISVPRGPFFYSPLSNAHHMFDEITLSPTKLCFADHPDNSWAWVYASCDGLLLVNDNQWKTFVLNPITREIRQVPLSPFALDRSKGSFDVISGFGYDSISDDYKIVTISYYIPQLDDEDNEIEPECTDMFVNVYSLKSGSWKMVESSPYDHSEADELDSGVFLHGRIHFLGSGTTNYESVIVAFDLAEEKFHEVPPPSSLSSDKFVCDHLAQLGGCLCLFDRYESDVWEFWMMKEYDVVESWTKIKIRDSKAMEVWPLCLLEHEDLVVSKDDRNLAMYNLKQGTVKDIVVHGIVEDIQAKVSFVESLVSPHAKW